MNKQIILEQCDKIKNVVTEATQNEEEARNNAEKFKGIKEENTKLLDLLNKTKDIYWEMERILRIIEIDKEYDNTDNELENLKINVKDLIDKLRDNTAELEKYDSVKETVEFYTEALKDATDFISGNDSVSEESEVHDDEDKEEKDESKRLRELIDTINMNESLSDGADHLDILSDLKGDDDETKVLGAKDDFMKETTKEAPVIRGLDKLNLKEEKDLASEIKKPKAEKQDIDLDKTNENTFLTTTNLFTESDFDDFNDLKEEVAGTKVVIKILIVIVILAFIVGVVFVLNKFLNLGWF